MPKHWIQNAIKHPGAFKEAAERAGKSTREFAEEHKHSKGKLGAPRALRAGVDGNKKESK